MNLPTEVSIVEVGPRDGLQNESVMVATPDKRRLIEALAGAGLQRIEVGSFVSPKWIPQMADGLELIQSLNLPAGIRTSALVPNDKGYESALQSGLKEIALFMSATESHNKKNINKTTQEAIDTLAGLAKRAREDGLKVRCYLSVVFVCPYEGKTDARKVEELVKQLVSIGIDELSLGDTIGGATPQDVWNILERLEKDVPKNKLALHFHDTRGTALANVLAGLQAGITIFDSSIGGMGGCPYAPGAAGNLATEDLVYMLEGMGIKTGVNLEKLVDAGQLAQELVKHNLAGRYLQACLASRAKLSKEKAANLEACK
ncbi:MAG: hydroxymethylglutaryl-CoA lyase [Candidatus Obscuribacterales bacterium]|jgi:hydroxymethylglutaryl-CoA lyase|nr:hydroxymethylglutaryl-CoA lyase [Candidatus Obscuribacterales bacterium]